MKMSAPLTAFMTIVLSATMASAQSTVSLKCKLAFSENNSRQSKIEELSLNKVQFGLGDDYRFDEVRTLDSVGRPDLILWTKGNYFRNNLRPVDTYLLIQHHLCQKHSTGEVNCFDSDFTTTLSPYKVLANTIYKGMTVLKHESSLMTPAFNNGRDFLIKYRLENGRSYQDTANTPAEMEKLQALFDPSLSVTCSVRDDDFSISDITSVAQ